MRSMERPARHTLSQEERLRARADFRRCIQGGARSAGRSVVVCVSPNGLGRTRLGAASTRRLGNAVQRNRQKRLVREAFRLTKHELPQGLDIVVLPKVPWRDPTLDELKTELLENAQRAASKLPEEA